MPRSRTKHENIMTGERIPKKFAFKVERTLPSGKVHAHTYDARTLSNWWKMGQRTLPHLGNTPATQNEQARVAAILASHRPGKMERFLYKKSNKTRSTPGNSSVNWSAPGKRTPSNLVHHAAPQVNELQQVKRATDSMLRKLYSRIPVHAPPNHLRKEFSIHQDIGNRIRIYGYLTSEQVIFSVHLDRTWEAVVSVTVMGSKAYLHINVPWTANRKQTESIVKALHVMITRQIISTLRKLDPAITFMRDSEDEGRHVSLSDRALRQFNKRGR